MILDQGASLEKKNSPAVYGEFQSVAHAGFEPAIFALRGRRPSPLDEWAKLRASQRPALYTVLICLTRT